MSKTEVSYLILFVFLCLCALEALWSWHRQSGAYNLKETLANLFILVGNQLTKPLTLIWQFWVLNGVSELSPFEWKEGPALALVAFLATDLTYYWVHRLKHEVKALWTFHIVHHSSPWMNLTTGFRINWLSPFLGALFLMPIGLMGLPPEMILITIGLNLAFQFLLHTQSVKTLGPLEGLVNTPSAHRVHHGSNPQYLDKNYGGLLMIWDRLFGTYEPEVEPVKYGVTTGFVGHNPIKLIFHGFVDFAKGRL